MSGGNLVIYLFFFLSVNVIQINLPSSILVCGTETEGKRDCRVAWPRLPKAEISNAGHGFSGPFDDWHKLGNWTRRVYELVDGEA